MHHSLILTQALQSFRADFGRAQGKMEEALPEDELPAKRTPLVDPILLDCMPEVADRVLLMPLGCAVRLLDDPPPADATKATARHKGMGWGQQRVIWA